MCINHQAELALRVPIWLESYPSPCFVINRITSLSSIWIEASGFRRMGSRMASTPEHWPSKVGRLASLLQEEATLYHLRQSLSLLEIFTWIEILSPHSVASFLGVEQRSET